MDTQIELFICYRRVDGTAYARAIFDLLDDYAIQESNEQPRRLRVYFDQESAAVPDWKADIRSALESSKALVVVSTPGLRTDFRDHGSPDTAYQEINYWIENRESPPIVIDTNPNADGEWVPRPIIDRWPHLNRIAFPKNGEEDSFQARLIQSVVESERTVVREHSSQMADLNAKLGRANDRLRASYDSLVKKNKILTSAAAFLALALLASAYFWRESVQNKLATEQATNTLVELFESTDPDKVFSEFSAVRSLLEIAELSVVESISEPRQRARLLVAIGSAYTGFEYHGKALEILSEANQLATADFSADDQFRLAIALGEALTYAGRYDEAHIHLTRATEIAEGATAISKEQQSSLFVAWGDYYDLSESTDTVRARRYYFDALAIDRTANEALVARDLMRLATLEYFGGDSIAAKDLASQAKSAAEVSSSPLALSESNYLLAAIAFEEGALGDAKTLYLGSLYASRRYYGDDHPFVGDVYASLGRIHVELGEDTAAISMLRDSLRILRMQHTNFDQSLAVPLNNLGVALLRSNTEDAKRHFEQAIEMVGPDYDHIRAQSLIHMAEIALAEGSFELAESYVSQAARANSSASLKSIWRTALLDGVTAELNLHHAARTIDLARKCEPQRENLLAIRARLVLAKSMLDRRWKARNYYLTKAEDRLFIADRLLESCA